MLHMPQETEAQECREAIAMELEARSLTVHRSTLIPL